MQSAFRALMLVLAFVALTTDALARPLTLDEFASVKAAMNCIAKNDYAGAVTLIKPIAEGGVPEAQMILGSIYQQGHGVQRDYGEAMRLYKAAAAQGNLKARLCVGVLYVRGWGVTKDYRQAAQWFTAAGDRDPDAQNNLGYLYIKGWGVPKDTEKAFQLFQRAANGGSADAKEALGEIYYSGSAKAKDFEEARKWLESAAKQKSASAQYLLGVMNANGDGAPADPAAARKWFVLAEPNLIEQARLGDPEAAGHLKELKSKYASYLTPENQPDQAKQPSPSESIRKSSEGTGSIK